MSAEGRKWDFWEIAVANKVRKIIGCKTDVLQELWRKLKFDALCSIALLILLAVQSLPVT